MLVRVISNVEGLKIGTLGYCSMVPIALWTEDIKVFSVRIRGKSFKLKDSEFEIIGEDDKPEELQINLKEQAAFVEKKIGFCGMLDTAAGTVFHFKDGFLRRYYVFDDKAELVYMAYGNRRLFADVAYEYCVENGLPFIQEMPMDNRSSLVTFNNFKHLSGSKVISQNSLIDYWTKVIKEELSS